MEEKTIEEFEIELDLDNLEKTELTTEQQEKLKKQFVWGMEFDPQTGYVEIFPMNGESHITIHGEEEGKFFTGLLMDYFRTV